LGQQGRGVFDAGQLDGEGDEYRMHLTGRSDNVVSLPGPVGVATSFNFWGGLGDTILGMAQEPQRSQDFVCPAIDADEETGFRFPQEVAILALPRALDLGDDHFTYRARYVQRGNAVTVTRSMRFSHAGMVCSARDHARMQALLERMLRDLRAQIIVEAR
jgi:hypothetical protein